MPSLLPAADRDGSLQPQDWMKPVMRAAAIYNLLWGTAVILAPVPTMWLAGFVPPDAATGAVGALGSVPMWQCIGMIVGVYGVGYWFSAADVYRHWPVILVGFLGKIFGPIGAVQGIVMGQLPPRILWTNLTNDLIWWIPFGVILLGAWRAAQVRQTTGTDDAAAVRSRFAEAVASGRTLVLFLRHSGCTFCRQAIADLDAVAPDLARRNVAILLIPPGHTTADTLTAGTDHLSQATILPDPAGILAADHGLMQGGFGELFGAAVWMPGAKACLLDGHGVGTLDGNGFQLPGLFLYDDGSQTAAYRHRTAHDRPDYVDFVDRTAGSEADRTAVEVVA